MRNFLQFTRIGIVFVLLVATFLPSSAQTIRRVTVGGAGNRSGTSWANASQLQAALMASTTPGDQVWIAAGTYRPHPTARTVSFRVPAGVAVYGGFAGTENALANRGGAATILSGDLAADDIERPATGDQTAYNATRDDNSRGVVIVGGANVVLDGLTITAGESIGNGAGLWSNFANTNVNACTFTGNEAGGVGGGAMFRRAATLTNCVLVGNTAFRGGGLFFLAGGTMINSTLYNNTATDQGGGIAVGFTTNNPFTLQNSILVGNTATTAGHQVRVFNFDAADVATLQNNLIEEDADPMGTDQGVVYTTPGSGNITQTGTVDESDASVVFASTDAMNANYLRLRTGSPAVNTGNNDYIPAGITTDAVGKPRILQGVVDVGAYESGVSPQIITFTSPAAGVVGTDLELTATGGNSGLPVTFEIAAQTPTSGTGNVATLTDNTLTLTGLGTVTITAMQTGNADYAMTTQTQIITARPAGATIFRVTTSGVATRDGSSWANAMTLQAALAASITAGDQVWVADGIYKPGVADDGDPTTNERAATFRIPAGVLVYGGFAGDEAALADRAGAATILSGDLAGNDIARPAEGVDRTVYNAARTDNSNTVVTLAGANVTLDGLTITAGESCWKWRRSLRRGWHCESHADGLHLHGQ